MKKVYSFTQSVMNDTVTIETSVAVFATRKLAEQTLADIKADNATLATGHADMKILYSILRREKFPEKIYNYRGKPSTIQPKTINGIPEREYYKQKKEQDL